MFTSMAILLNTVAAQTPLAPIAFEQETLDNGLRVIYAPLRQAPVVHVRVIYNVGSADERPDRQGFAHLFEHMMFRGSAHVAQEEHMRLILQVGGVCNAFTSYDQTCYWQTVPAEHTEMALYLEADRMASFKVNDEIFKTERDVVAEEWRLRYANQPYGPMFQDFSRTAYTTHSYRWTTIGDMDQLRQASSPELQEFFNRFYVPNNACLVLAGDFDVAKAKQWVRKYYGWIPRGSVVRRDIPDEPGQTQPRRLVVRKAGIPLPQMYIGYRTPGWRHPDHYALQLLGSILTSGRSSRLDSLLVNGTHPLCRSISGGDFARQDPSLFYLSAVGLPGTSLDEVEKLICEAIAQLSDKGVSQEELDKARREYGIELIRQRENAQRLATHIGEEEVFGGDANRVNREWTAVASLTPADIQAVAKRYFQPQHMTVLQYVPDATAAPGVVTTPPAIPEAVAESAPVKPRDITFPADYPSRPPMAQPQASRPFEKGVESQVGGVKVIVMSDHRLPMVNWTLVMRAGSDALPSGKHGLGSLTAGMIRRGADDMDYLALSQDLESRGITIDASDDGDNTRLRGSCPSDQFDHAITRTRQVLVHPTFPETEFKKLKAQMLAGLEQSLANPATVADRQLSSSLWGDSPMGRLTTPQSLRSISLDDVKQWHASVYRPNNALLVISGDVTVEQGKAMAEKLLADWKPADTLPRADYSVSVNSPRRIILVDNPRGRQSTIRMAVRAYTNASDEKFAGALAGRILSDGIHSRLDRYVRAEKGYTYGAHGVFAPGRHSGSFDASVATKPETTADCIRAMLKVFNDVRSSNVTETEMLESKSRAAGVMVMDMQTVAQQAARRIDGILNGYPIDYYDQYAHRLSQVTADQVRQVMNKWVREDAMTIVVVAPAHEVKTQLESLGPVEVVPMPLTQAVTDVQ
jgi:zinc protease